MSSSTGIQQLGDYTTPTTDPLKVAALLALIPNVDQPGTSGPQGGGGYLDEMSPACAVQLRIEIAALMAKVS